MATDLSYNCFYPIAINGLNNLVNSIDSTNKTSLKNFGKSELMSDVYCGGRLAINKAIDGSNNYYLDISGNSCFRNDIIINNKNSLSKVQYISSSVTLTFGSPEYVAITSTCPTNAIIYLPVVTSVNQIGCKFTFFYADGTSNPTVNIYGGNATQNIADNVTGANSNFINITYSKPFVELVCVSNTGICWSQITGIYSYDEFGSIIQDNTWDGINYFLTPITSDNSTRVATTAYVKSNLSSYLLLTDASTNYLKKTDASTNYLKITDAVTNYLTTTNASSIYQPISNMYLYITNSSANTLFLAKTDASNNYLKIADAAAKYQTIDNMSYYITYFGLPSYLTDFPKMSLSNTNYFYSDNRFPAPNESSSISIGGGLRSNQSGGTNNLAIGNALTNNTTSDTNLAIGNDALKSVSSNASQNCAVGYRSMESLAGGSYANNAFGFLSGYKITTNSSWNSFFGIASGAAFSSSSNYNFCMGFNSMATCQTNAVVPTDVNNNIALGGYAMYAVNTGIQNNVAIGYHSLSNPIGTATPSLDLKGNNNIAIGSYSGFGLAGSGSNNNVFIGHNCSVVDGSTLSNSTTTSYSNITAINSGTISSPASNSVYLGNSSVSNTYLYGVKTSSLPTITTSITSTTSIDNLITRRIADLTYIPLSGSTDAQLNRAQFNSTTDNLGAVIAQFSNSTASSGKIQVLDTGAAMGVNSLCISSSSASTNGLGFNADNSSGGINFHIAKTLVGQILSTGLSITGNMSFTGTLNTVSTTIFSYISTLTSNVQTQINNMLSGTTGFGNVKLNNKYWISGCAVITANISLTTYPIGNEFWSINVSSAITITLPTIAAANLGTCITFRRTAGSTTAPISFVVTGGTQSIFNLQNVGNITAQVLIPSGSYSCTLAALNASSTSTFAWYQVA